MIVSGLGFDTQARIREPDAGGQRLPAPIAFREGSKPLMVVEGTPLGCFLAIDCFQAMLALADRDANSWPIPAAQTTFV
jgi:hypothetical protein